MLVQCVPFFSNSSRFELFPNPNDGVTPLPLLPPIECASGPKPLTPEHLMGPPTTQLSLSHGPALLPAAPYHHRIPAKTFHLPTPPTCPHPLYLQLLNKNIIPRYKTLFDPLALQQLPLHGCSVDPTPQMVWAHIGPAVPMLGGPDEILPPNAIVPLNGTADWCDKPLRGPGRRSIGVSRTETP
jgi:hypothetical protein